MEEKKTQTVFRQKSLEAIESPESMNDYLQVTSPQIWLILCAVIAVLVGVIVWSVFGRINTTVNVAVISKEGTTTCLAPYEKLESIMSAGCVGIDGQIYSLKTTEDINTIVISETTNPYVRVAANFSVGDVAVEIPVEADISEGVYNGSVTTESLQPITLLIQ